MSQDFLLRISVSHKVHGIIICHVTTPIENSNRWLQEVLMKMSNNPEQQWDITLPDALEVLRKRIVGYLGFSPTEIALDHIKAFTPRTSYLNPDNADEELWTENDTAIRRPNLMRRRAVDVNS
ncbi:predicted protein [Histoplasma capsulatum G186AR]|uniref:Uncharacterized protein n=1 Tax=Ajellomyces capsulatus (strain G186AR / H82 / ATCC MYA-2454 / RMSCC 2432) TaxID=447093 RepID=C0NUE9_AJECG|nr:uncharacterized protein HCBG_06980 [Histoplasma capsulatum G186AR]EEH05029.1 predicted protein [Histoplasma capsulatum G186AR]